MSCPSVRMVLLDPEHSIEVTEVACTKPHGHRPHTRHRAVLDDGSAIEWEGGDMSQDPPRET